MAKIQISDHIVFGDGSSIPVIATITRDGCSIAIGDEAVSTLTWVQMVNVEYLSDLFADTTVRKFKVIVDILGKVYTGRDIYKLLV